MCVIYQIYVQQFSYIFVIFNIGWYDFLSFSFFNPFSVLIYLQNESRLKTIIKNNPKFLAFEKTKIILHSFSISY